VFDIYNDKAMRQELEVNLETLNGNPFRGTLMQLEAKYLLYKEPLKLDLSNFDRVRVGYKTGLMMLFKSLWMNFSLFNTSSLIEKLLDKVALTLMSLSVKSGGLASLTVTMGTLIQWGLER
jgi:hypothetical protein